MAGNAAPLFEPESESAIAAAMRRLLTVPGERGRLVTAGRERVKLFSWAATAAGTLESYQAVIRPAAV